MKNCFIRFISSVLVVVTLFVVAGCGNNETRKDGKDLSDIKSEINNNSLGKDEGWLVEVGGVNLHIPCSLKDLEETEYTGIDDYEKQAWLNAENEFFGSNDGSVTNNYINISVEARGNSEKGSENVFLVALNTFTAPKSEFCIDGEAYIGNTLDNVIEHFGDDYNIVAQVGETLNDGFARINYVVGDYDRVLIVSSTDGVVDFIEYYVKSEVE